MSCLKITEFAEKPINYFSRLICQSLNISHMLVHFLGVHESFESSGQIELLLKQICETSKSFIQ